MKTPITKQIAVERNLARTLVEKLEHSLEKAVKK